MSKSINQYMNSVNLMPTDIPEKTFEVKHNTALDPSKLDMNCDEKKLMSKAVLKLLKKIAGISNSSLVKNVDGLLYKKPAKMEVEWIGKSKTCLRANKY